MKARIRTIGFTRRDGSQIKAQFIGLHVDVAPLDTTMIGAEMRGYLQR